MQFSIFSTDNQKSGFRLQYMEVFNWGTFDETIHSIKPMGETSLLTGANGSGKTTFVDALLTLIVPEKKYRFYNQSSGSEKKGDRTEDSYVLGGYGTVSSDASGTTKTLYLRDNKEAAYSILLAHFANEAEQFVTLFQVRYFANGDMKKVFGVAHKPLHIEEDFKPFDLGGQWKKTIDQRYNKGSRKQVEWFDAASKYAHRLVDLLGMQSIQALHLFNQTVGIKVLGNLDEFIRTHMLEPRNIEDQFQELKSHLSTLLDARRNIEKAEAQIELLEPLQQHYHQFHLLQKEITDLESSLHTAAIWHRYSKFELLNTAISAIQLQRNQLKEELHSLRTQSDILQEEERQIRNQIDQNKAGQRMQQLEKEVKELELKKEKAEKELEQFISWCEELHLEEKNPVDEASYLRIQKDAHKKSLELTTKQRINEEEDYEAKRQKDKSLQEKNSIEEELNGLLVSKNNIPPHLIALRKEIADAVNIYMEDLPFAGELMQIHSDEMDWQPTIEKLLHSFSLRLLVPDKFYKKVNKFVNNNNIRGRLVYEHITDIPLVQIADPGTVFEKLDFHPDHNLSEWVQQQIIRQFNYVCLKDEKTIDRYDRAITLNGLIKNGKRHEKDDRNKSNDAGNYVMGWNNDRKKELLLKKRNQFADALAQAEETLQRCRGRNERIQKQFYAIHRIKEHGGFGLIDAASIQRNIHKLSDQANGLKKDNKALHELKDQLQDILTQKEQADQKQRSYIGKEALLQNEEAIFQQQRNELEVLVQMMQESDKDALLHFQQENNQWMQSLQLSTIDEVYNELKKDKANLLDQKKTMIRNNETQLNRCIVRLKNPSSELLQKFPDWLGDTQNMPEDPQYALEYIEWLNKLQHENLPRFKKDFENYINVTITYKIGGLNEELEKWERDIHQSVQKLNLSLGSINFNRLPDTFIQLRKHPVPAGSEIREFKHQLLEALPQSANWQQSSFEEKANHFTQKVQPLIEALDASETYRNKVMDVRNWFEFWADEKFRNNDELKKTYRQMGQLSGGEKAQLTYTILCSAIAYQFGITREGRNSKSLRFIAVDESFSNQDEEKATYLMELCKQLHLQLLVVTPSDKIQIVQDFIAHVHLAQRVNNRHSIMYNMTIKELQTQMQGAAI